MEDGTQRHVQLDASRDRMSEEVNRKKYYAMMRACVRQVSPQACECYQCDLMGYTSTTYLF